MNLRDPFTMLITGLAVGIAGSFTDDLFGGSAPIAVLQVGMWIGCAALVLASLVALRRRSTQRPSRRVPSTGAV